MLGLTVVTDRRERKRREQMRRRRKIRASGHEQVKCAHAEGHDWETKPSSVVSPILLPPTRPLVILCWQLARCLCCAQKCKVFLVRKRCQGEKKMWRLVSRRHKDARVRKRWDVIKKCQEEKRCPDEKKMSGPQKRC